MATIALLVVVFVSVLPLTVGLTYAASRILKTENATWRTAYGVVGVVLVLNIAYLAVLVRLRSKHSVGDTEEIFLALLSVGAVLLVYRYFYRAGGKQLLGFFILQIVLAAIGFGIALPLKWYVAEAFVIPTNSMAPNISGIRREGRCPECGGLIVATIDAVADHAPPRGIPQRPIGTCRRCGKDWEEPELFGAQLPGDKIIVAKWYEPERWDVIVFRYPGDPSVNYVKRLVGMPGEEIVIGDDGFLIVNGKRLEPPSEFADLHYSTTFPNNPDVQANDGGPLRGTAQRPMKLGPDEYFMLGDNPYRALDARFWGPVKGEAIIGTATLIYWPPSRWRIFK
jgi:signal peptidase I